MFTVKPYYALYLYIFNTIKVRSKVLDFNNINFIIFFLSGEQRFRLQYG